MDNLKPFGDRVLVQRLADNNTTKGGIILPDSAKKKTQYGTVIAIGDKHTTCKVGDIIFMAQYSGIEIDEIHMVLKEDEVLAIVIPE
jgi:chaperonin GroES